MWDLVENPDDRFSHNEAHITGYHRQKQLELASQNDLLSPGVGQASPRKFGPISRQRGPRPHVITPPQPPQIYPVALVKPDSKSTRGSSKSVRHDPYPISLPRQPIPRPRPVLNEGIDPYSNQRFSNFSTDNGIPIERIADDSFTRNMQEALKVKLEALDNGTESDSHSDNFDDNINHETRHSPQGYHNIQDRVEHSVSPRRTEESGVQRPSVAFSESQDVRTNERHLASYEHDIEFSKTNRRSSEIDTGSYSPASDPREIKLEALTESEMELEITGVDPGRVPHSGENWVSNIQDMIGSLPAGSSATSQGETTQESYYHRDSKCFVNERLDDKTCLHGIQPCQTQTGLYSHRI